MQRAEAVFEGWGVKGIGLVGALQAFVSAVGNDGRSILCENGTAYTT